MFTEETHLTQAMMPLQGDGEMTGRRSWKSKDFPMKFVCAGILILNFLSGCGPTPLSLPAGDPEPPRPHLEIYVMPENPQPMDRQRVLLAPLRVAPERPEEWQDRSSRLVEDVLVQQKVFSEIERVGPEGQQEELLALARSRGFDYVLLGELPPVIHPAGNSPGWLALDMKLVSVRDGTAAWHFYGEVDLVPVPARHSILRPTPFRPAPTVYQGLAAVVQSMARAMLPPVPAAEEEEPDEP
jgi:hypothetical protein